MQLVIIDDNRNVIEVTDELEEAFRILSNEEIEGDEYFLRPEDIVATLARLLTETGLVKVDHDAIARIVA